MRIAVSVSGNSLNDLIDLRFGRCAYFQIYDDNKEKLEIIENEGNKADGGAGIIAAKQILNENVDVLITGKLGPNAFKIIDKSSIDVFECNEMTVSEALEKYKNNELVKLETPVKEHSGMGNGFKGGK